MKIYTKTGDTGMTGLYGGARISKAHIRLDAYGTVDELNSFLGGIVDYPELQVMELIVREIQSELFNIGAHLATESDSNLPLPELPLERITWMEQEIDRMEESLPPLKNFILPGGHPAISALHICRTVCRRAERQIIALHQLEAVNSIILQYFNRMSDYIFVLARYVGMQHQIPEVKWIPPRPKK